LRDVSGKFADKISWKLPKLPRLESWAKRNQGDLREFGEFCDSNFYINYPENKHGYRWKIT